MTWRDQAPNWVRTVACADWYEHSERRWAQGRVPTGTEAPERSAQTLGEDGLALLAARAGPPTPAPLRELSSGQPFAKGWAQHSERRTGKGPPTGTARRSTARITL